MGHEPSPVSDTASPMYKLMEKQLAVSYPAAKTAPYVMLAASDSRYFTKICNQVFRFSPFAISSSQLASIHGADENIQIDSLTRGVHFYRDLVYNTVPGSN